MVWEQLKDIATAALQAATGHGDPPVHDEPFLAHTTPDSLLARPTEQESRFIASRPRLATCSGVAWFHDEYLATINLVGNALHTYRFSPRDGTLTPVQAVIDPEIFHMPENLAFSPDGSLLVTTNSRDGAVHVFAVDGDTHLVDPGPLATIRCEGDINTHGVSFSPCSRYFAFTTVDSPGFVRVCRISENASGRIQATVVQDIPNGHGPLKPKGIDFSPNGRFVTVCYAPNAGLKAGDYDGGMLCIYPYDEGHIDTRPVACRGKWLGLCNPDDVKFFSDGSHLVVTNQTIDSAIVVGVDEETGKLGKRHMTLTNPRAQMSFPHGIGISRDGRYLAIANYGDDTLRIYAIRSGNGRRGASAG